MEQWHLGRGLQSLEIGFIVYSCFWGLRVACFTCLVFVRFVIIKFADLLKIEPKETNPMLPDLPMKYHPEQQQSLYFNFVS